MFTPIAIHRKIFLFLFVTLLAFMKVDIAIAAPSAECRALAKKFWENAVKLSDRELANLSMCITEERTNRPSARPPQPSAPPPPPPPYVEPRGPSPPPVSR